MRLHHFRCRRKPLATNLRPTRFELLSKGRVSSGDCLFRARGVQTNHHRPVALKRATGNGSHPDLDLRGWLVDVYSLDALTKGDELLLRHALAEHELQTAKELHRIAHDRLDLGL